MLFAHGGFAAVKLRVVMFTPGVSHPTTVIQSGIEPSVLQFCKFYSRICLYYKSDYNLRQTSTNLITLYDYTGALGSPK